MFSDNLVANVLRHYWGLVVAVLGIYIAVNIVVGINTFSNMNHLATIVREDVSHNGYLTPKDEKAIRDIIQSYEKPNDTTVDGPVLLGLNKVLRNIRIYVYDPYKNIGGEFPTEMWGTSDNPFAGTERLKYRRQQGETIYAGITFDYYLIIPFGFWRTSSGGYTTINEDISELGYNDYYIDNTQQVWNVSGESVKQKYNGSGDLNTEMVWDDALTEGGMYKGKAGEYPNATGGIQTYIEPISCFHYYPDIDNNTGYAGDDY